MSLPFLVKKWLVRSGLAHLTPAARRLTGGDPKFVRYCSDKLIAAPADDLLDAATFPQADAADVMPLNLPAPRFDSPVGGWRFTADRTGNPDPAGLPALREAVAEHYHRRDARTVDPASQVLVAHGATAAFAATLDAFVNSGDKVVLFDPCSPLFGLGAKSRRAKAAFVPTWNETGRTRFLHDTLAKAMRGAMLLVLADPCNPTGGTLRAEDLEQVAWLAKKHDVLVYLDESFGRFRYDDPAPSLAALPGMDERLISVGSMTQGYGLGSLRVGWLSGHRALVRTCGLAANLSAPFVPTACQQAAVRAVQAEDGLFAPTLAEFRSKRQYAVDRLRGMGLEPTWPGGGFSTWVPVSTLGLNGRTFAERLLREFRVLVGPGCAYGPTSGGHVRVSFAVEDGRLREGLTRMAKFVETLRGVPVVESARVTVTEPVAAGTTAVEEPMPAFSRV